MDTVKKLAVAGLVLFTFSCRSVFGTDATGPETSPPPEKAATAPAAPVAEKAMAKSAPPAPEASNQEQAPVTKHADALKEAGIHIREMAASGEISSAKALTLKLDGLSYALARNVSGNPTMVVATFVDLDRLNRSNTFGRYVTESLMGNMAKLGFSVVEPRTAKRLMHQPNVGDHALTQEQGEMMNAYKADAVLLGTYKKTGNTVLVHARLVTASTQKVVSAAAMEMTFEKDDPLAKEMFGNALERIGEPTASYEGWKK
jgi:TolB-like protein